MGHVKEDPTIQFLCLFLEFIIHPRITDHGVGYPTISPKTILLHVQNFTVAKAPNPETCGGPPHPTPAPLGNQLVPNKSCCCRKLVVILSISYMGSAQTINSLTSESDFDHNPFHKGWARYDEFKFRGHLQEKPYEFPLHKLRVRH